MDAAARPSRAEMRPLPGRGGPVLLSDRLKLSAKRRLAELTGLLLGAAGIALIVALLSYDARDPSLDTATSHAAANLAGLPGAAFSDLLIQAFGVMALLPSFAMLVWAWRIAAHRGFGHPLTRLLCLAGALPALAASVACLPLRFHGAPLAWPAQAGLGGAAGAGLAAPMLLTARDLPGPGGAWCAALLFLLIGAVLAWSAFGLSVREWRLVAYGIGSGFLLLWRGGVTLFRSASRLVEFAHRMVRPLAAQLDDRNGIELPPPMNDHLPRTDIPPLPAVSDRGTAAADALVPTSFRARVIAARVARTPPPQQEALKLEEPGWTFPSLSLLKVAPPRASTGPSEDALHSNARLLESVLADYGVQGTIRDIHPGPVVTLYELEPAPGIRSARVIGLADDVARSLSVTAVRIATVPGRNVIGIEVPNAKRETVYLSELIGSAEWGRQTSKLALALGKDIGGLPQIADLARMPHLLIAGTTGSGKSVGINAMILSLLYRLSPDQCRMIMIDPKMLELSVYEGIPHLMAPVVTEPAKAVTALKWTVREMERRYRAMTGLGVRNIGGYNERVVEARASGEMVTRKVQTGFDPQTNRPTFEEQPLILESMPLIVVVIDEMADLMMVAGKEIEAAVQRLAQMARAAGIHVIMATQRPSVDVITGTIKANFPTRVSFQVISKFDSRTILGEGGAEQLLGQGDMLYMAGGGRITRVHSAFVSDGEVEAVVAFLREQGEPAYVDDVTEAPDEDSSALMLSGIAGASDGEKGLFDQAVAVVAREGKASTSFIQRHLQIGYNKAAKLIEQMEREGVISTANHVGRREVLVRRTSDD